MATGENGDNVDDYVATGDIQSYIDSHSHLYDDVFNEDLDAVVLKAKQDGVKAALVVAENAGNCLKILQLAESFPDFCLPCFGVHPVQGDPAGERRSVNVQDFEAVLPYIEEHHENLIAIGEVGLDFTPRWCKTDEDKQSQRDVLSKQVVLAKKYGLPLNIHSRSAGRPTIALLKELGAEKVLMHAFDGKPSVALAGIQHGFYFSIPPCVLRSEQKQKLIKQLPLERILLETDSPALGPTKEGRNVPSNIRLSCEYIAKVKQVSPEVVARAAWQNTLRLFPRIKRFLPK